MKKAFALIMTLALLLSLAACGSEAAPAAEPIDLNAVYESMQETLPDMFVIDETTMLNFLGIQADDCLQVIAAVSNDGLRADEVWLIEAADEAALERLQKLAETRLTAKEDETITYSPDQYAIVEKAVLMTEGNYLVFLVSPDVDTLKATFEAALN